MATSEEELVEQAKAVVASHEDNCRRCDLEAVLTNVADDVVVLASEAPLIEGRTSLAIDGEIIPDPLLEPIPEESEIHFVPRVAGG